MTHTQTKHDQLLHSLPDLPNTEINYMRLSLLSLHNIETFVALQPTLTRQICGKYLTASVGL
jgi:hypothetical protein